SSAISTAAWSDSATVTSQNRAGIATLNFSVGVFGSATGSAFNDGPFPTTGGGDFGLNLTVNGRVIEVANGTSATAFPASVTMTNFVDGENLDPYGVLHFSAPF